MKIWDLEKDYDSLLNFVMTRREEKKRDIRSSVEAIKGELAKNGDTALLNFSRRWDGWKTDYPLKVPFDEIVGADKQVPKADLAVLKGMISNVTAYHKGQKPKGRTYRERGVTVKEAWVPVERATIYVPAGTAPYPSSLVMGAVPAKIAGVNHISVATPARDGKVNPYILACAKLLGIKDVFRVGGAQAVYAFAYGTETIPRVDMIVGPGNAYVEEAKRDVYGRVGIDMLAGPTELIIVVTEPFSPEALAWDMFSQAEHDEMATVGLFSTDKKLLAAVVKTMERLLPGAERRTVIEKALQNNGFLVYFKDLERAVGAVNRIAPEHLEFIGQKGAERGILYPGIIYAGPNTTVALGDYYIGTNHILPTSGAGRFAAGLSVDRFMRRRSVVTVTKRFVQTFGEDAMRLASIEGLFAHSHAIRTRKELKG
jgi:histidinol dehydrogenase